MKEFAIYTPKDKYVAYKKPDRREEKKERGDRRAKTLRVEPEPDIVNEPLEVNADNLSKE